MFIFNFYILGLLYCGFVALSGWSPLQARSQACYIIVALLPFQTVNNKYYADKNCDIIETVF